MVVYGMLGMAEVATQSW